MESLKLCNYCIKEIEVHVHVWQTTNGVLDFDGSIFNTFDQNDLK
jgi:hypothetical protein